MYLRILGLLSFLVGIVVTLPTVASDIYKMSLYGEGEDTALMLCFIAAHRSGFSCPNLMAMILWLSPVFLMVLGLFLFAGNHPRNSQRKTQG